MTPKKLTIDSTIQKIDTCSFYNKNKRSKFKTALLNHIEEAFHTLSKKYTKGLHFILGADANHLNLDTILNLRGDMRSVVEDFTRMGPPPAMLDPIITTLGSFYQRPVCHPPLESDEGSGGKAADHLIVKMEPINMINNQAARSYRKVTVRPMPESSMDIYNVEMEKVNWDELFSTVSTHKKAEILQAQYVKVVEKCFPQKVLKVSSDDRPWWTEQLQKLHRAKKRVYRTERKSQKWMTMEKRFQAMKTKAKKSFYHKMVNDMIEKEQNQWYSQLKRLTNKGKTDQIVVDQISHLSDKEQAESIADHISSISQEYDHLQTKDIEIPSFLKNSTPHTSVQRSLNISE